MSLAMANHEIVPVTVQIHCALRRHTCPFFVRPAWPGGLQVQRAQSSRLGAVAWQCTLSRPPACGAPAMALAKSEVWRGALDRPPAARPETKKNIAKGEGRPSHARSNTPPRAPGTVVGPTRQRPHIRPLRLVHRGPHIARLGVVARYAHQPPPPCWPLPPMPPWRPVPPFAWLFLAGGTPRPLTGRGHCLIEGLPLAISGHVIYYYAHALPLCQCPGLMPAAPSSLYRC